LRRGNPVTTERHALLLSTAAALTLGVDRGAAYVDPILVALVVTLFIGVPIRIARRAILELLNRAPPEDVAGPVRDAVHQVLAGLPVQRLYLRMVRPGRTQCRSRLSRQAADQR
jgi:predicted Co/Zn/Cd cation transporter (cation efflux family)